MKKLIENLLKLQTLEFDETAGARREGRIAELRAQIPAQILGHYDRLVARGKKGLAAVRNEVCTGCHMHVPRAVILTLMHGDDIQLCDCCGRYLYLPEQAEIQKTAGREKGSGKPAKRNAPLQTV